MTDGSKESPVGTGEAALSEQVEAVNKVSADGPLKPDAGGSAQAATDSANAATTAENNTEAASLNTGDESSRVVVNRVSSARWFKSIERLLALMADVAVVAGIIFAFYQIRQAELMEKRRVAISAVGQTRTPEFLKAYRMLKKVYESKQVKGEEEEATIDSLNLVMNVYDDIAIVYINDVADRCIIKKSIQPGAQEMSTISNFIGYEPAYRKNFDSLLSLMQQESCVGTPTQP